MKRTAGCSLSVFLIALASSVRADGPGVPPGRSRAEVEEIIRAVGREPITPELVDRVQAVFRPLGTELSRHEDAFELTRRRLADPRFVAGVDRAAKEVTGKAADTRMIVLLATEFPEWDVPGEDDYHALVRGAWRREQGPKVTVSGRVVDEEEGRPLPGVVVSSSGLATRTEGDGSYRLAVPRPGTGSGGSLAVSFEAPGKALGKAEFLWVGEVPEEVALDFKMVDPVEFGGRVLDTDEKPIAGALLRLNIPTATLARGAQTGRKGTGYTMLTARSDADGRYTFSNVPPPFPGSRFDPYGQFITSHPKYITHRKNFEGREPLGPGFAVVLERGRVVAGRVVDPAGKGVGEATIWARSKYVLATARTDADGRFRFENLPPERVELIVRPIRHVQAVLQVDLSRDRPAELDVTVEPGSYFEGTVVDDQGRPVAGASVGGIERLGEGDPPFRNGYPYSPRSHTREDGTFRVGPVAPGLRYRLWATGGEPATSASVEAETDGKPLRLELKPDRP